VPVGRAMAMEVTERTDIRQSDRNSGDYRRRTRPVMWCWFKYQQIRS